MNKLTLIILIILFYSCSNDVQEVSNSEEVVITGYQINHYTSPEYNFSITGTTLNNKLLSETYETFINGVSQGQTTQQKYFYNNEGLLDYFIWNNGTPYDLTTFLYYDLQQRLIGAKLENEYGEKNYRFIYNNNYVYFEPIGNFSYDDVNAILSNARIILEFNDNDDIISAGLDTNLDGIQDQINTFQYINENVITATYSNGEEYNFNYTNIINTRRYLWENGLGKKNDRVLSGECYYLLHPNFNTSGIEDITSLSKNILQENGSGATYQVLTNNFYELKTEVQGSSTITTQYFFQ